jgi:hypothetical protein
MQYVEGITFHDLAHSGDHEAIAEAAFFAGETLAAIGRFTFPKSGWLAPGPAVTTPLLEGAVVSKLKCPLFVASEMSGFVNLR